MQEWTKTRDVIQILDDKLYDLKKYGFSFITAHLTVQGLLLLFISPSGPVEQVVTTTIHETTVENGTSTVTNTTSSESTPINNAAKTSSSGLPDGVKIGVLGVTSLLVIALKWLEGHY